MSLLDAPLLNFADRVSLVRRELAFGDVRAISQDPVQREVAAHLRAATFVWLSAALEAFVRDTLRAVMKEIEGAAPARRDIRLSALSLLLHPEFESAASVKKLEMWERRAQILGAIEDGSPVNFDGMPLPLDGRTLRARHFEVIWSVYGFDPPSLPKPHYRLALSDLADSRNQLAHGEVDPIAFGRNRPTVDVQKLAHDIEDVAIHLHGAGTKFLVGKHFVR